MGYRKFKADQLFTGRKMLSEDNVLIMNDTGIFESITTLENAGENVEILSGLISPGFINAHCHLELSHLKGLIPKHTGLVDFVFKVVTERHFDESEIIKSIAVAESEMLENGIVATGDICNNLFSISQKEMSKMDYYNFIECSGWAPAVADDRFAGSKLFYDEFVNKFPNTTIVPHAPYSVSDQLWKNIIPYFKNKVVTIHNQETSYENEYFLKGTGDLLRMYQMMNIDTSFFKPSLSSSVKTYFKKLEQAKNIILVHNTFINVEDINYIKENSNQHQLVSFCICINANLYIENTIPPVQLLREKNCNIILGTDSLASNDQLSILGEMKTIGKNFPTIPMPELLSWATINGARALDMANNLGSFEPSKSPGVVLIDHIENERFTSHSLSSRIM